MLVSVAAALPAGADDFSLLQTDYQNPWYATNRPAGVLTNYGPRATAFYGGQAGFYKATNGAPWAWPSNASTRLQASAMGQPLDGLQAQYRLGDELPAPPDAAETAPVIAPSNSAYYSAYTRRVYAVDSGVVRITWRLDGGGTRDMIYVVSAATAWPPVRIFWTEGQYSGPTVQFGNTYKVNILYNSTVRTNDLWLDSSSALHAREGASGRVILEYTMLTTNGWEFIDAEIVEILAPIVNQLSGEIGGRLLPLDRSFGNDGLYAQVTRGVLDQTDGQKNFVHIPRLGNKKNWVFAVRKTDKPSDIEIYWKRKSVLDVLWPYEVDQYSTTWPDLAQINAIAPAQSPGPTVLVPTMLRPTLWYYQEPMNHAKLTPSNRDGSEYAASQPGRALLQYTASDDDTWFEVIQSVWHDDRTYMPVDPVEWPMGREIRPMYGVRSMEFNGTTDYLASTLWTNPQSFTLMLWFKTTNSPGGKLIGFGDQAATRSSNYDRHIYMGAAGQLFFGIFNNSYQTLYTPRAYNDGAWHCAAATFSSNGAALYVDGVLVTNNPAIKQAQAYNGYWRVGGDSLGSWPGASGSATFFRGRLAGVCVWDVALTANFIAYFMRYPPEGADEGLDINYPLQSLAGRAVDNLAQPKAPGAVYGNPRVVVDDLLLEEWSDEPDWLVNLSWTNMPGYLYAGTSFQPAWYSAPTNGSVTHPVIDPADMGRNSHIWAVNTNQLEVWWCNASAETAMPLRVYWPSLTARYMNVWPTNAPEIVIASGLGSGLLPDYFTSPSIYYQNSNSLVGYNPNEEHALLLGGRAYALRDDLNTPASSEPFVLLQHVSSRNGLNALQPYHVIATNAQFAFAFTNGEAGKLVQAPMPVSMLPRCTASHGVSGPYWRDRNQDFWAMAAADNGGATSIVMRFYYPMQPSFAFPALVPPPVAGAEIPWLSGNNVTGLPVKITYAIRWPDATPSLYVAETLAAAKHGLPAIRGQKSVDLVYQQSLRLAGKESVVLLDPTRAQGAALTQLPDDLDSQLVYLNPADGYYYFRNLPPHLRDHLYYNAQGGTEKLFFKGQFIQPLSGDYYLLLNYLSGALTDTNSDRYAVASLSARPAWKTAVSQLATSLVVIVTNTTAFDSLALSAGIGQGAGYVTLAFNNSTNQYLVSPGDPISLSIIRVVTNLYSGDLKTLYSDNPLDEKVSLRHSADLAGQVTNYQFQWFYHPDPGGQPGTTPETEPAGWIYLNDQDNGLTIQGPGVLALQDLYYICRYRPLRTNGPAGTGWSTWVAPQLVEGWIKRVMAAINPFDQRIKDYQSTAVNALVTMIGQAGQRYEGDVPLNESALNDYGLISIYETVLRRSQNMSIDGLPPTDSEGVNNALMLAAGRINDLYMLLGNEAYADAQDPTIAFGTEDAVYGSRAPSIFCFMNQVPTLLDEELALLRGRGDDPAAQPALASAPVYNRLAWNFTRDITGGEVAYALNYNVRDPAGNVTGTVSQASAAAMYPQGHGDAWGHYLSAIWGYYRLLRHPYFTWVPRSESVNTGDGSMTVDISYLHERRFAQAAAARARAGAEILNLTWRQNYLGKPDRLPEYFRDTNTNRAWGVGEWAVRAGQAAYFDWVMANAILPAQDAAHAGIRQVDRTTVPELTEIAARAAEIQEQMNSADAGLNPLGLADSVVPFDISPAELDLGTTHFEQIYARAVTALDNAATAFDNAADCTQWLRRQNDSLADFQQNVAEEEQNFENRLLELYGYPFADDIGPGKTYPQGYQGPDLYHYQYLDLYDLMGDAAVASVVTVKLPCVTALMTNNVVSLTTNDIGPVEFHFSASGFMVKPAAWSGSRRASGDLQLALRGVLAAYAELQRALADYAVLETQIAELDSLIAQSAAAGTKALELMRYYRNLQMTETAVATTLSFISGFAHQTISTWQSAIDVGTQMVPLSIMDPFSGARAVLTTSSRVLFQVLQGIDLVGSAGAASLQAMKELAGYNLQIDLAEQAGAPSTLPMEISLGMGRQSGKLYEIQALLQKLDAAQQNYQKLLAEAQRVWTERSRFRASTATELQQYRYKDMAFRIFRNDALQKYRSAYDLAARYVFLAAKAYDYETGLLASDTQSSPGAEFLAGVVRARALGSFIGGTPAAAGAWGDPGLADIMARMKGDWDVIKGRLGFNNPDNETGRFSLRTELFRIVPGAAGDAIWRATLTQYAVDDILSLPVFRQYCLPFDPRQAKEPGLMIPFSTSIYFGENFFGHSLAAGDNAYDSSHFATKIRSVGVWFQNYNNAFTNTGGLANQPRVYLVPAGSDITRAPSAGGGDLRVWSVVDQALPLPYNIGQTDLNNPNWVATFDSLSESLAQVRKYSSLRAYHDAGFNTSEMSYNARLVGRSVWNTQWYLIIPAGTLLSDRAEALARFIDGALQPDLSRDHNGVKDIKLFFQTYSYSGN